MAIGYRTFGMVADGLPEIPQPSRIKHLASKCADERHGRFKYPEDMSEQPHLANSAFGISAGA